jgi:cytochrome P450
VSSPFLSHHNSEVYPEPSLYDPERFADPERKQSLVANRHYVQFGFGRHKCLVPSPSTTFIF